MASKSQEKDNPVNSLNNNYGNKNILRNMTNENKKIYNTIDTGEKNQNQSFLINPIFQEILVKVKGFKEQSLNEDIR